MAAARRRQRRRRITQIVGIGIVVLVLAALFSAFAGDDDEATGVASEGDRGEPPHALVIDTRSTTNTSVSPARAWPLPAGP